MATRGFRHTEDGFRLEAYTGNPPALTCRGGVFGISGMRSLKRYISESFLLYVVAISLSVDWFCTHTYLPGQPPTRNTGNPFAPIFGRPR